MVYVKTTQSKQRRKPTGGAIRKSASIVDQPSLERAFEEHVKEAGVETAFHFGVYLNLPISHAVRGHALACNYKLLKRILVLIPSGVVNQKPLSDALETCAWSFKDLAPKTQVTKWAAEAAYAVFVMLNHLRRLKYSPLRQRQAKTNTTHADWILLESMLGKMADVEASQNAPQADEEVHASQVSVDSDGFPMICNSAAKAKDQQTVRYDEEDDEILNASFSPIPATKGAMRATHARLDAEEKESDAGGCDDREQRRAGAMKKPAAAKPKIAAQKNLRETDIREKNRRRRANTTAQQISYKVKGKNITIKLGCYSKQSYIQTKEGSKWKLWAAISACQSSKHGELMRKVFLMRPPNKVAAVALRDKICRSN
jgi:hypothetical protein